MWKPLEPIKPIDAEGEPIKQVTFPRGYVLCATPPAPLRAGTGTYKQGGGSVVPQLSPACAGCGRAAARPSQIPRSPGPLFRIHWLPGLTLPRDTAAPSMTGLGGPYSLPLSGPPSPEHQHLLQWPPLPGSHPDLGPWAARSALEHPTGSSPTGSIRPRVHTRTLTAHSGRSRSGCCRHLSSPRGHSQLAWPGRGLAHSNRLGEIDLGRDFRAIC